MQYYGTLNYSDWIEPETEFIIVCDSCYDILSECEQDDPIEIDGRIFCDSCGSDYIGHRMPVRKVSAMTHELRMENAPTVNMIQFAHKYYGYEI